MWSALSQWSFDPVPVCGCALAAALYWLGTSRWGWRTLAFYCGLLVLFLALVSPLDTLDLRLQWLHMVQHILLLVVAPPLILLGDPFNTAWAGLQRLSHGIGDPPAWVPRTVAALRGSGRGAALVLALFSVDLLAWHIPALYNATLQIDAVHNLEHTLFLATGLLYWDLVVHAEAAPGRLTLGARAAFLLGGMVVSWVLAIVIGYASHPLYAYPTPAHGPSLLQDQQIAAGVMWVPGSIPFVAALFYLLYAWFEADERGSTPVGVSLPADVQ
jgi:putative membrane protein